MKLKKNILNSTLFKSAIFSVAGLFLLLPGVVNADAPKFALDTAVTYNVQSQDLTKVNYHVSVTNKTSTTYLSGLSLPALGKDIQNVRATYADGAVIPSKVEHEDATNCGVATAVNKIVLAFPRQIVGSNKIWVFNVSFESKDFVIKRSASASIVYVPTVTFSSEDRNYSVTIITPEALGMSHFSFNQPDSSDFKDGKQTIIFSRGKLEKECSYISFGDAAYYLFTMRYPLKNPIPWWKTIWITLPPESATQDVFIQKINVKPTMMKIDADGNILAGFRLSPFEKKDITADVVVATKFLEYDLSVSGKKSDIPAEISRAYTKDLKYWETKDPEIKKLADTVYKEDKPVAENVRALYDLTRKTLKYNAKKLDFNLRFGAAKALKEPNNAVCMEFADTLIAMLRAEGIPARNPIGYAYGEGLKPSDTVADSLHSWVEAYIPNVGWIQVDPTWGVKVDNFGKSDFDHVAFAVYGLSSDLPSAEFVGGLNLGYEYEKSSWQFTDKTEANTSATLSTVNIPLPMGYLISVEMKNIGNSVIYNTSLSATDANFYPGNEAAFGNTAPLQSEKYYFLGFAKNPMKKNVKLILSGANVSALPAQLAEKSFALNYLWSWLIAGSLILFVVALILLKVRKRVRAKKIKNEPPAEPPAGGP